MDNQRGGKPDWQIALEHHEDLCAERYNSIDRRLDNLEADMRELRAGQRWIISLILVGYFAWPTALIAFLKLF